MGKQYRSDALAAVHETALGLAEAGVMGKRTMKAWERGERRPRGASLKPLTLVAKKGLQAVAQQPSSVSK